MKKNVFVPGLVHTDLWLNEIDIQGGVCDDCYDKLGHGSLVRDHPHFAPDPYKATGLSVDGSSAWLSMNGSGSVHTSTRPENGYVCQFDCLREYVAMRHKTYNNATKQNQEEALIVIFHKPS